MCLAALIGSTVWQHWLAGDLPGETHAQQKREEEFVTGKQRSRDVAIDIVREMLVNVSQTAFQDFRLVATIEIKLLHIVIRMQAVFLPFCCNVEVVLMMDRKI